MYGIFTEKDNYSLLTYRWVNYLYRLWKKAKILLPGTDLKILDLQHYLSEKQAQYYSVYGME